MYATSVIYPTDYVGTVVKIEVDDVSDRISYHATFNSGKAKPIKGNDQVFEYSEHELEEFIEYSRRRRGGPCRCTFCRHSVDCGKCVSCKKNKRTGRAKCLERKQQCIYSNLQI